MPQESSERLREFVRSHRYPAVAVKNDDAPAADDVDILNVVVIRAADSDRRHFFHSQRRQGQKGDKHSGQKLHGATIPQPPPFFKRRSSNWRWLGAANVRLQSATNLAGGACYLSANDRITALPIYQQWSNIVRIRLYNDPGNLYWDPVFICVSGEGWELGQPNVVDNTTLFDFTGHALPSHDAFDYNN